MASTGKTKSISMQPPEPQSVTFTSLFNQVEQGTVKIPQFQRAFVWTRFQSARNQLEKSSCIFGSCGHESFTRPLRDKGRCPLNS
jgi:hypothetical protein